MNKLIKLLKQLPFLSAAYRQRNFHFLRIEEDLKRIALNSTAMLRIKNDIMTFLYEDEIIKFYLPYVTSDELQKSILLSGTFYDVLNLESYRKYISKNAVGVDAGTNIGNHTVFFSKICKCQKIYSFEPQKTMIDILKKNLQLNMITDVTLFNAALGKECGKAELSAFLPGNFGATVFHPSDTGNIDLVSLDSLELNQLDFLKIDVEGGQLELLKGAAKTLQKFSPVIFIELYSNVQEHTKKFYSYEQEVLLPKQLLQEYGYQMTEQLSENDYVYCK